MKWIHISGSIWMHDDGEAAIGRRKYGHWFFMIGDQVFDGYANADDAKQAADEYRARTQEAA